MMSKDLGNYSFSIEVTYYLITQPLSVCISAMYCYFHIGINSSLTLRLSISRSLRSYTVTLYMTSSILKFLRLAVPIYVIYLTNSTIRYADLLNLIHTRHMYTSVLYKTARIIYL